VEKVAKDFDFDASNLIPGTAKTHAAQPERNLKSETLLAADHTAAKLWFQG
jgi:hypothetical protein